MDNFFEDFLNVFVDIISEILFKEIKVEDFNFTICFEKKTILKDNHVISAQIRPLGIIYMENKDYYFAPLAESYNLDSIVKAYIS